MSVGGTSQPADTRIAMIRETLTHVGTFLEENAPAEWDGGDLGYEVGGIGVMLEEALAALAAVAAELAQMRQALKDACQDLITIANAAPIRGTSLEIELRRNEARYQEALAGSVEKR